VPVRGLILRRHFREPLGVLGHADALEELDGFPPRFASASLRVIALAISWSMIWCECGSRPGNVVSEELVPESVSRIPGRDSGFWFGAAFSVTPIF
jgi:hypothetical protein